MFISLPLFAQWRYFFSLERQEMAMLDEQQDVPADQRRFARETLVLTRPINPTSVSISGVASVVSFVLPIVQLFLK
jgi:hypothetical protein